LDKSLYHAELVRVLLIESFAVVCFVSRVGFWARIKTGYLKDFFSKFELLTIKMLTDPMDSDPWKLWDPWKLSDPWFFRADSRSMDLDPWNRRSKNIHGSMDPDPWIRIRV